MTETTTTHQDHAAFVRQHVGRDREDSAASAPRSAAPRPEAPAAAGH